MITEAFADRAYAPDGTLVPRRVPGSVIEDTDCVVDRVLRMVTHKEVVAVDGSSVTLQADSICVHGDTPGAVAVGTALRAALSAAGIPLAPFAEPTG